MYPWTKPIMDYWFKSIAGMCSGSGAFPGASYNWSGQAAQSSEENPWQIPLNLAQTMFQSFTHSFGAKEGSSSQSAQFSELFLSMMQTGLEGYVDLQEKWLEGIQRSSRLSGSGEREDFMKIPSMLLENFQSIFKPLLNMPTVGLTRSYQEQANQVVDKYYVFTANMSELLYQLNVPMEEATKKVQEKIEEWTKEGKPTESKQSYERWVSALEGCYMELFQSPDYIRILYKTVDSYSDFLVAQQQVYGNSLRNLPVPTTKDMDELSKEIYLLKKRLKEVAKRVEVQYPTMDQGDGNPQSSH